MTVFQKVDLPLTPSFVGSNPATPATDTIYCIRNVLPNTLEEQCNCFSDRLSKLQSSVKERKQRADVIGGFMFEIKERDGIIDSFDDELWITLLESVTITREGKWLFKFKNERVIEV